MNTPATHADVTAMIGPPGLLKLSARREQLVRILAGAGLMKAETLATAMGVNPKNLHNHVEQTRTFLWARGMDIENERGRGYRLIREDDE